MSNDPKKEPKPRPNPLATLIVAAVSMLGYLLYLLYAES